MSWNGNSARAQYSLAIGSTSARRKSRTRVLMSCSAGESSPLKSKKSSVPVRYPPGA
jgi:hypothetical protein